MSIPCHVRRFGDYANRKVEKIMGNNLYDKKSHFLNVRNAGESKVIILSSIGNKDDADICNTGEFSALQPHFAAELACRLEDAIIATGFDFETYREKYMKRGDRSEHNEDQPTG